MKFSKMDFIKLIHQHPSKDCILWPWSKNQKGYPHVCEGGRVYYAHRISCEMKHGPSTNAKPHASHLCHEPRCINPDHLEWTDPKGNSKASMAAGRIHKGTFHGRAKITEKEVKEIREKYKTRNYSFRSLGRLYGLNNKSIASIVRRENWKHVP